MSALQNLSGAAFVELLDEHGQRLAIEPVTQDADDLRLALAPGVAQATWHMRLLDKDGITLAEIPTRHAFEVGQFAGGLVAGFRALQ